MFSGVGVGVAVESDFGEVVTGELRLRVDSGLFHSGRSGNFAFIVFDKSTSMVFVVSDQFGKIPLSWGITADGYVAFADDAELLKGACGKSLASFPQGCFYSMTVGGLRSYENPKNKITAVPATDEEISGATFKVEGPAVFAATK
ncbi:hypothetical protein C1H46_014650 [Malus baccata]|uniref:DUF3700 domain-containing protein n=1 Tax=Malus baccata TaxID=106549 RepID=A0A540MLT3_MALBA|nr:hypothetical protein C1H46_014650 [Malus baccata]